MSVASDILASPLAYAILTHDVEAAVTAIESDLYRHCGSTQRPHAFLDLTCDFEEEWPEIVWRALHSLWPSFDLIPHDDFADLFQRLRPYWRRDYLPADDVAFYDGLPERFTVYRGQCASKPIGLSWTMDTKTALAFARGHRGMWNKCPVVYAARIRKSQVAGSYTERQEAEVVTFSTPNCVRLIARGEGRAS